MGQRRCSQEREREQRAKRNPQGRQDTLEAIVRYLNPTVPSGPEPVDHDEASVL
jgi:hypothetical protein